MIIAVNLKNYAANYLKVRKVMMEKTENEERNNPFYIMDISNVTERIKIWKQLLPRVEIFYACKTNPNEEIIKATMKENTCYDVASLGEI